MIKRKPKPIPHIRKLKLTPRNPAAVVHAPPRPHASRITSILEEVKIIDLPEHGAFNAGIAPFTEGRYVCVYRPDEHRFIGCILDHKLEVESSFCRFKLKECSDPRLVWLPDGKRLLMVYASTDGVGIVNECIRGGIIMDLNKSPIFQDPKPFNVSPHTLNTRQKNWMPFVHEDKVYMVASVHPHVIYELVINEHGVVCKHRYESKWLHPWFYNAPFKGGTNAVLMEDGNYMGVFHTSMQLGHTMYYDNGCYVFEGKPPFRVLRCGNRTFLPAESAVHPHFRKHQVGRLLCNFPVGMIREGNHLLISYGDNDSVVKIMRTTVDKMLSTTVEVYPDA